jgi:hypothetical protein
MEGIDMSITFEERGHIFALYQHLKQYKKISATSPAWKQK